MHNVFIGIGTNLGDRMENIRRAEEMLSSEDVTILNASKIEETDPVDFLEQPKFLNQVIFVKTELSPLDLLRVLKNIEITMGRTVFVKKGPRIIDLDILLYDDYVMYQPLLRIPHPGILNRLFVMKHILEINQDSKDPVSGVYYKEAIHEESYYQC